MSLTDLTSRALLLVQTAATGGSVSISLRDIAQGLGNTAAIGAFVFAWQTKAELTRLKTVLLEPKVGAVDRIESHGGTIGEHSTQLAEHETRLDGHDREFREIKRGEANYPAPQRGITERHR